MTTTPIPGQPWTGPGVDDLTTLIGTIDAEALVAEGTDTGAMHKAANLGDVANAATARTNLGVDQSTLDGRYSRVDRNVYNVLDHGVVGDGTTDDTDAINALGLSVSNAGGGTIVFPCRSYKISRGTPNVSTAGIKIYSNVEYHFDNATLTLAANCSFINASSTLGTGVAITADTATTDSSFTVTSSSGYSVGQQVFVMLGQAAYDTGEPDHWLWAKVLSIPDSTHLQLDRPCGYAMSVAATTNTAHRMIYPLSFICENWAITGSVDLVNPMTGAANAESGLRGQITRNARVEKISGINVGAGLIGFQYGENIDVGVVNVRSCAQQLNHAAKGRAIGLAESRNINIATAELTDCESQFIYFEGRVEECVIQSLRFDNGYAGRSNSTVALMACAGNSRPKMGQVFVSGASAVLLDTLGGTGGGQQTAYIDDITFRTAGDPTISDLSIIRGSLNVRGNVYSEKRTWSTVIPITASMNAAVSLVAGLVRGMRVYASTTTGISVGAVTLKSTGASGQNLATLLTAGQLYQVPPGFALTLGSSGPSTAVNRDDSRKSIQLNTDGTVPAGAYLIVEVDYFRPPSGAEDYSQGRNDASGYLKPTTGIPESDLATALQSKIDAASTVGSTLAMTIYKPTTKVVKTTTSTSYVDVDATNCAVTFTAPASGAVTVYLEVECQNSAGAGVFWNLRDSGGSVSGTNAEVHSTVAYEAFARTVYVSGLTPGTSYTWKWGWKVASGTGSFVAGGTDDGPAVMIVRDAGTNVTVNNPG